MRRFLTIYKSGREYKKIAPYIAKIPKAIKYPPKGIWVHGTLPGTADWRSPQPLALLKDPLQHPGADLLIVAALKWEERMREIVLT